MNQMMLKSVSNWVTPQMDRPSRIDTKTRTAIFTGNLTRVSPKRENKVSANDICKIEFEEDPIPKAKTFVSNIILIAMLV